MKTELQLILTFDGHPLPCGRERCRVQSQERQIRGIVSLCTGPVALPSERLGYAGNELWTISALDARGPQAGCE